MTEAITMNPPAEPAGLFVRRELMRVGTAATMIFCGGAAIVLALMPLVGYSGLAHAGPRAVLHGMIITLLIGQDARWRCLALLGVVLGIFLGFIQPAIAPLFPIFALAGSAGAAVGRCLTGLPRWMALAGGVVCFELLTSLGAPLRILFATRDGHEPLLWAAWLAEWPLRIAGGLIGVWLGMRWLKRRQESNQKLSNAADSVISPPPVLRGRVREGADWEIASCIKPPPSPSPGVPREGTRKRPFLTAVALFAAALACILPMVLQSWTALAIIAGIYLVYAWGMGLRRALLHIVVALAWAWAIYAIGSYLWHRDLSRVADLGRTLALRFAPMALAALVIIRRTRPLEIFRLLRKIHLSPLVLIPLSDLLRSFPHARREVKLAWRHLQETGIVRGRWSILRRPRPIIAGLFGPMVRNWADRLVEK